VRTVLRAGPSAARPGGGGKPRRRDAAETARGPAVVLGPAAAVFGCVASYTAPADHSEPSTAPMVPGSGRLNMDTDIC
jgi:hypothetical protein